MLEAKEVLKQVTPDVVVEIMQEHGTTVFKETVDTASGQRCYWFQTICHGGDSHKLCYFSESRDFFCYTNCGKMPFWNFIMRIQELKENEFHKAVQYVAQKVGYSSYSRQGFNQQTKEIRQELSELEDRTEQKKNRNQNREVVNKVYNPGVLEYFDPYTFYKGWIDEGISIKSMYKFGIRWDEWRKHIIIPHYNMYGELVGIRRRSLDPKDVKNKYMPEILEGVTYEHALNFNLYGLYENLESIKKQKRVLIVEAEKSVLLSDTYYGKNSVAVATCGFNISSWQLNTLLKLGVEEVTLGFDKDYDFTKSAVYRQNDAEWKGFQAFRNRLHSLCERIAPYCNVYISIDKKGLLQLKDSPLDRGKETFEKLMKLRIPITTVS